jgi:hypothetical protein
MPAYPRLVIGSRIVGSDFPHLALILGGTVVNRWDKKAGLRRNAVRSQVIDALEAQEIKDRQ